MKFRVKTFPRAESDLRSITAYLYERSPQGAAAWVNALDRARKWLADNADVCGEADENLHFEIDVKQKLFKIKRGRVYRLLFTIVDDEARVLRVRGPGQAPVAPEDIT